MTLVELMIAMLILTLVCTAWLEIIGIQSAKKEARRREAVERLAGMMDAFMYIYKTGVNPGAYYLDNTSWNAGKIKFDFESESENATCTRSLFGKDVSPIGYRLRVVRNLTTSLPDYDKDLLKGNERFFFKNELCEADWRSKKWLIGQLFNYTGDKKESRQPFFTLPVCLGL